MAKDPPLALYNKENGAALHGIQMRIQLQLTVNLIVLLGCLAPLAQAADCTGVESNVDAYTSEIGPKHHPIGRPLPRTTSFNQPTACVDGIWFFDLNGNGRPDPGEPRLFGPQRVTGCSSCHGESADTKTETGTSVFLRQNAVVLCLVCHKL